MRSPRRQCLKPFQVFDASESDSLVFDDHVDYGCHEGRVKRGAGLRAHQPKPLLGAQLQALRAVSPGVACGRHDAAAASTCSMELMYTRSQGQRVRTRAPDNMPASCLVSPHQ